MSAVPEKLFLIGPMGSGKTTVGRALAERWGMQFIDIDEAIEARCGVEVDHIFEIEGEAGFRVREASMLKEVNQQHAVVVATGGGTVMLPENRELLKAHGITVWLRTTVAQQLKRLSRDRRRPLLQTPDRKQRLTALAEIRNPLYETCADIIIDSSNITPHAMAERVAQEIMQTLASNQH